MMKPAKNKTMDIKRRVSKLSGTNHGLTEVPMNSTMYDVVLAEEKSNPSGDNHFERKSAILGKNIMSRVWWSDGCNVLRPLRP